MSVKELLTGDCPRGRSLLDPWRQTIERYMLPGLNLSPPEEAVSSRLASFDFAGARLWFAHSGPHIVDRTRAASQIRFVPTAVVQLKGNAQISQFKNQAELAEGDYTFVDAAQPLQLKQCTPFQQFYVQFPSHVFTVGEFHKMTARRLTSSKASDRLFFEYVRCLWQAAPELNTVDHAPALSAIISLCKIVAGSKQSAGEKTVDARVERAVAFIESHLEDTTLTAEKVAHSQRVSRRYLDELFDDLGHSVTSWIWERRLDRAKQIISLPDQQDRTLLQIALDLGFKSPSHFSRVFTSRYGIPPREYRKQLA